MAVRLRFEEIEPRWLETVSGPSRAAVVFACPACGNHDWTVWLLRDGHAHLGVTTTPERVVREATGMHFDSLTLGGHLRCCDDYIFLVEGNLIVG